MKRKEIVGIIVAVLGLMAWPVGPADAVPMGTAWTYQGRLMDANDPADGLYDFTFKLYDADVGGNKAANDVNVGDLDVIDGYFTVELDFGAGVFDGDGRWLEVGVRPGESTGSFTTLSPRQEVTPMPYSLQTRGIFVDDSDNVGIGTRSPVGKLQVGTPSTYSDVIYEGQGKDDLSLDRSSAYTDNIDRIYIVTVAEEGNPDAFEWSDDGGVTWSSEIDMTTSWYELSHGVRIKWDNGRGHSESPPDTWAWVAFHGHEDTLVVRDGKVGIGTSNPVWELDVANTAAGDGAESGVTADDAGGAIAAYSSTLGAPFSHYAGRVSLFSDSVTMGLDLRADSGGGDIRFYTGGIVPLNERMRITAYGNVGIGTMYPGHRLHVSNTDAMSGGVTRISNDQDTYLDIGVSGSNCGWPVGNDNPYIFTENKDLVILTGTGFVGIGTADPQGGLHVSGHGGNGTALFERSGKILALNPNYGGQNQFAHVTTLVGSNMGLKLGVNEQTALTIVTGGNVGIGTTSPTEKLTVRGNLLIQSEGTGASVLELGEGLDYAEGFDVSARDKINAGSVLIIDADNPGKLALSNKAYDTKVAGIVAGGKGLGSGVRLGAGQYDYDVALAGRVYCKVDATDEAIQAGDLLTTSATPGYAMKAVDYTRSHGAILGKAMESLEQGQKGQILVLVTLQ